MSVRGCNRSIGTRLEEAGDQGSLDGTARLWNLSDPVHPTPLGPPLTSGQGNFVTSVVFSLDGHVLAFGSDATVRLWSVADPGHPAPLGQPLLRHTDIVSSVAFSPDGHTLASGSTDHTIRLWPTPSTPPSRPSARNSHPTSATNSGTIGSHRPSATSLSAPTCPSRRVERRRRFSSSVH